MYDQSTGDGVEQKGTGCQGYSPRDTVFDDTTRLAFGGDEGAEDDVTKAARFCDGDHAFWLVGVKTIDWSGTCERKRSPQRQFGDPQPHCNKKEAAFDLLHGWDQLDGTQWAGKHSEG